MKETVSEAWENSKSKTSEIWGTIKSTLSEKWSDLKTSASERFKEIKTKISESWNDTKSDSSEKWNRIKTSLSSIWNSLQSTVSNVFNSISNTISNIWNGIASSIRSSINSIIGFINGMISGIVAGINIMINALNSLHIDVPDWIPSIGGKSFGFITAPQIPYLASGAVIPPNAPFLAVLGDQKHGTNIEAPLSAIEETVNKAIRNAMGNQQRGGTYIFEAQLDRRTIFRQVIEEAKLRQTVTGRNPFELA